MAGDWIKIETTTPDKPEVVQMAGILRLDQDSVVGKLVRVWAWADANSVTGAGVPVTLAFLDRLAGRRGFGEALVKVGWLVVQEGNLSFPQFERHNGSPAKSRAMERDKKRTQRAVSVPDLSRCDRDKIGTREEREKSSEENSAVPPVSRTRPLQPDGPDASGMEGTPVPLVPTLEQVLSWARSGLAGIDPEVAETWWNECEGAGWLDGNRRPILRWQGALTAYCRKWKANVAERDARQHRNGFHKPTTREQEEARTGIKRKIIDVPIL